MSSENSENQKRSSSGNSAEGKKYNQKQRNNKHRQQPKNNRRTESRHPDKNAKPIFKNPVKTVSRRGRKAASRLKIIPLGGLEQIGMNITAF